MYNTRVVVVMWQTQVSNLRSLCNGIGFPPRYHRADIWRLSDFKAAPTGRIIAAFQGPVTVVKIVPAIS